jgi:serine/threonine protein kinase
MVDIVSTFRKMSTKPDQAQVEALQAMDDPALLRLLDADASASWMVSEYHPGGTLAEHPNLFKGKPLEALMAFEPLVSVVIKLHELGLIHRDIKPANVFIASDGRLVLCDFGIVFWADDAHNRLTETYERVGSRDWMAPWANQGRRLADVNATFDVFPLAKVLWAWCLGSMSCRSGTGKTLSTIWNSCSRTAKRCTGSTPEFSPQRLLNVKLNVFRPLQTCAAGSEP